MHDPMVVAHDIRLWPNIRRHSRREDAPRVQIRYQWRRWYDIRPKVFRKFWNFGNIELYWPAAITIWHVEPGGHDALTVCKHNGYWRWHIHHWTIRVAFEQKLRRWLFERCIECGRRYPWGYAPVSHQWDGPRSRWFRINRQNYHAECSSLTHYRRQQKVDETLIRFLVAEVRVRADESEDQTVERLTGFKNESLDFHLRNRLQKIIGYDRDDDYNLVRREADV